MRAALSYEPSAIMGVSRGLAGWMQGRGVALMFLSQAENKLGVVALDASKRPVLVEHAEADCRGLAMTVDREAVFCAAATGLVRWRRARRPAAAASPVRGTAWPSGGGRSVLAVLGDGRPLVSARGDLVAVSPSGSLEVVWRPPARLRGATLTGVAVDEDGTVSHATAWRERAGRREGLVVDLSSGEIAISSRSAFSAPRLENGWLWLVDTDRDDLCVADPGSGLCEIVARCPGRVRGLALIGDRALIGLSPSRIERARWPEAPGRFHGLVLIDTHRGAVAEWLALDGVAGTIDDVALVGTRSRPRAADAVRGGARAEPAPPA